MAATAALGVSAIVPAPAAAASKTVTISDLLLPVLGCGGGSQGGTIGSFFCVAPSSVNLTTGETLTFNNTASVSHTVRSTSSFAGQSFALGLAPHTMQSVTFAAPDRIGFSVDGVAGVAYVSSSAPPGTSSAPTPPPNGTGPSTTTHPGTIAGSGTSKPRVVAAGTPQAGPIAQGPQGSSALPPVDALASPTPDASTLPPLTVPTPTPRAKVIATSATSGLSRRTALYIAGAVLFAVVALTAGLVIGIRRWRRGGTDSAFHPTA